MADVLEPQKVIVPDIFCIFQNLSSQMRAQAVTVVTPVQVGNPCPQRPACAPTRERRKLCDHNRRLPREHSLSDPDQPGRHKGRISLYPLC